MDTVHSSGSGVFYQAIPAIGADGKNIMKLIPVKMVNGQYIHNNLSMPRMYSTPHKAVTVSISSAPVQMVNRNQEPVRSQVSFVNASPQSAPQQQTVNSVARVPLPASHLRIPSNTEVLTVPACELPPGIKKQLFTSSASSSDSGARSVVYVSPVTPLGQDDTPPGDAAPQLAKPLSKKPSEKRPKALLKLAPKPSSPNSPIKWVIEEEDGSLAPNLNPLDSPSLTSEILHAVAERESIHKQNVPPQPSQGKSGHGQDTAITCNGKVFLLAPKCDLPFRTGMSSAAKSYQLSKTILPLTQQYLESAAARARKGLRKPCPRCSDEVIDLCDDDSAPHPDDDNVIFVSYIPPKSEAGPSHSSGHGALAGVENIGSSDGVAEGKGMDERSGWNVSVGAPENAPRVCGVANAQDDGGLNVESQASTSTQPGDRTEAGEVTACPADPSIPQEQDAYTSIPNPVPCQAPSLAPGPGQTADRLLRQVFGITAEVRVCLQRIDDAAESLKRKSPSWAEDHQEPEGGLKRNEDTSSSLISVKRVKAALKQEVSGDPVASALKCAVFRLKTEPLCALGKCHSGQSSPEGFPCNDENAWEIGYMEPIDEDLPSTEGNDVAGSRDTEDRPQTQTCADPTANMRRVGRTRRRTTCQCCVAGALEPTVDQCEWVAEPTGKKGGRAKAPRKDGKTRIGCPRHKQIKREIEAESQLMANGIS